MAEILFLYLESFDLNDIRLVHILYDDIIFSYVCINANNSIIYPVDMKCGVGTTLYIRHGDYNHDFRQLGELF